MKVALVGVLVGLMASVAAAQSQSAPLLIGTWRLVSFEGRDSKGEVQYPFGERVTGQLVYDAGGNMSVQIMKEARSTFASNDPTRGTDKEVREAFEGYLGYFGTFSLDPVKHAVTHHVRGSSNPNVVGADQLRFYKFERDRLLLSTPPIAGRGTSLEIVLVWERVR
jgi:hypothetical protein